MSTTLFSYKPTYKVTIRYTPYQLVYGLHPLMLIEYIVPIIGGNERFNQQNYKVGEVAGG
jgi:hypothetical protein